MAEEKKKLPKKTLNVNGFLNEFEKDDIKRKVDLADLFQHFGVKLSRKGNSYKGLCPFHPDKNPSLSVSSEKGLFHCFGCEADGDHFDLVMRKQNTDFKGALAWLRNYAGLSPKAQPSNGKHPRPEQALPDNFIDPILPEEPTKLEEQPQPKTQIEPETPSAEPDPEPPANTASNSIQPDPVPDFQEADLLKLAGYDSVTEVYHRNLKTDTQAQAYLQARGLLDWELVDRFKLGYSNGKLLELCSKSQIEDLKIYGFVNDYGKEHFKQCITFPIQNTHGQTESMYGRSIRPGAAVPHLYLKGGHKGVFNLKASKVYNQIVLTECIIDALSLIKIGVQNVQALYGANGFTAEHLQQLKDDRVKTIILALDNDEAGRKASESLKTKLLAEGFQVKVVEPFNTKDWNEALLLDFTDDQFRTLCDDAQTFEPTVNTPSLTVTKDQGTYTFTTDGITYKLPGIREMFAGSLKVNMRAEFGSEKYFDNLDLYSARSRAGYSQSLSQMFGVEPKKVERDLVRMLEYLEEERDKRLRMDRDEPVKLTDEDRALGMELLTAPDMFNRIIQHMEVLGYVGEDLNKLLLYLCASSRVLDDPISILILSQSASGKSMLVDTVRKLIPPEDVIAVTSLSDQALNYMISLLHKFLILSEAVHSEIIEHQIREMLSGHELTRLVTVKDEKTGKLSTQMVKTPVIVASVMTSTNHRINPENASRCFLINTDESREQTRRIHQAQRQKYSLERYQTKETQIPQIIKQHHAAQRMLRKLAIVNPFAKHLDFPDTIMRVRRDHERFIDLIAAVCFLRQYQKQIKTQGSLEYIECDLEDYRIAHNIMINGILSSTMLELPAGACELYEALRTTAKKLALKNSLKPNEVSFTQREIREATGYGQSWIKQNLRMLSDYEYILRIRGGERSKSAYRLREDEGIAKLDLNMIPTPETMEQLMNQTGQI